MRELTISMRRGLPRLFMFFAFSAAVFLLGFTFITHRENARAHGVDLTNRPAVTVVLTEAGFEPENMFIAQGTRVTFKTVLGVSFWPASDPHPSHTVYAVFDPQRPIAPDETWDFTFADRGEWNFHNHLDAAVVGRITVLAPGEKPEDKPVALVCNGSTEQASECWTAEIKRALDTDGLSAAFARMHALYGESPEFGASCHPVTHQLGLWAYAGYKKEIPLVIEEGYCDAGFFHGYMEGFLSDGRDSSEARDFCSVVEKRLGSQFRLAGPQCIHGVGHGMMEKFIHSRPDLWSALPKLVDMSVRVCGETFDTYENRFRCASGAYSVLADWTKRERGMHIITREDPFMLCRTAPEEWAKRGCVWELAKRVRWFTSDDPIASLSLAVNRLRDIDGGRYIPDAVQIIANAVGQSGVSKKDADIQRACDDFDGTAKLHCMFGLLDGLFQSSEPGHEAERVALFCVKAPLIQSEKFACATYVLTLTEHSNDTNQASKACGIFSGAISGLDRLCGRY